MYTHYPDTISSTLYPILYRNIQPDGVEQLLVSIFVAGASVGSYRASYSGTTGTSGIFLLDSSGYVGANVAPGVNWSFILAHSQLHPAGTATTRFRPGCIAVPL